jgi:putative ABC transport system ATP-binding protein
MNKTKSVEVKDIVKNYYNGKIVTEVLKGVSLDVYEGEFVAIMGKSGAGKSTLLYQISLLDEPTSGHIHLLGERVDQLNDVDRTQFRLEKLGYVFQDYALVPDLSAEENVMLPLLMLGLTTVKSRERARDVLDQVGLEGKYKNLPNQLSGGQQQRVSIARAMGQNPSILFADEPTANLDTASSQQVLQALEVLHHAGQTIVMITHEKEYTKKCDRVLVMEDGTFAK